MHTLTESQIRQVADAKTSGGTDVESSAVDTANWEQVTFWATIATADADNYMRIEQDDVDTFATAEIPEGATAIAAEDGDVVAVGVNRPLKRYVRAVIDRGGTNTATGEIYCALTGSRKVPVDNNEDNEIVSAQVASPEIEIGG
jgi:hypothetical protein